MHVDICNTLPLFADYACSCPVAESTADTLQLPVYSRLGPGDVDRVLRTVQEAAKDLPPLWGVTLKFDPHPPLRGTLSQRERE